MATKSRDCINQSRAEFCNSLCNRYEHIDCITLLYNKLQNSAAGYLIPASLYNLCSRCMLQQVPTIVPTHSNELIRVNWMIEHVEACEICNATNLLYHALTIVYATYTVVFP